MEIKTIKNEAKELIVEFDTKDYTIPDLIANEVRQDDGVEFSGVERDHPEVGNTRLIIKTSRKKAVDVLLKAIGNLEENFEGLKEQVAKKSK